MADEFNPFAPQPVFAGGETGPVGFMGAVPPVPPGTPVPERDEFGQQTGRWITYDANGRPGPYQAPSRTQTVGDTSAQIDGAGVPYVIRGGRGYTLDGSPYTPVPLPQRDPNAMTGGQSAQIGLGYAQLQQSAQQFEETQKRLAEQMQAQIAAQQAQIAQKNREIGNQEQVNAFLQKQTAFQNEQGLRKEAAETEQRLFQNQVTLQQMQTQRAVTQAQMDLSVSQFNAQQQAQSQRDRLQFESQRQDRLQSLNKDIGTLASDANDRGKYAATVMANRGWGQAPGALASGDLRTDESLQPLQGDLNLRTEVQNQTGPAAYQPISSPQLPGINLSALGPQSNVLAPSGSQIMEQAKQAGWTTPAGYTGSGQGLIEQADMFLKQRATQPQAPAAQQSGIDLSALKADANQRMQQAGVPSFVPQFAEGGITNSPIRAVGERGPELEFDRPDGTTVVFNQTQLAGMGINLKKLLKHMDSGQKAADGGIFGSSLLPTTDARQFGDEATRRALSGTPWQGQGVPSAVYAAAPGFDPIVRDLLASVSSLAGKGPAESFKRNAALYTPTGMNERVVGRSA